MGGNVPSLQNGFKIAWELSFRFKVVAAPHQGE